MPRFLSLFLFFLFSSSLSVAQSDTVPTAGKGKVDETLAAIFTPASEFATSIIFYPLFTVNGIAVPFILLWLVVAALFFTFYLEFIN